MIFYTNEYNNDSPYNGVDIYNDNGDVHDEDDQNYDNNDDNRQFGLSLRQWC